MNVSLFGNHYHRATTTTPARGNETSNSKRKEKCTEQQHLFSVSFSVISNALLCYVRRELKAQSEVKSCNERKTIESQKRKKR